MKKVIISSLLSLSIINAEILPSNVLSVGALAKENGGVIDAIDAYNDGSGVYIIGLTNDNIVDNSPMNSLVFKYGDEAKSNNVTLIDQINTISTNSTPEDKILAAKILANNSGSGNSGSNSGNSTVQPNSPTGNDCEIGYVGEVSNLFCQDWSSSTNSLPNSWLNLTEAVNLGLSFNSTITNVDAFANLQHIYISLSLINMSSLTNINGFSNLTNAGENITLSNLPSLTDISGLANVTSVGVVVFNNDSYNFTKKLPANSYICQNYETKIYIMGLGYATPSTKLLFCEP